MDYHLSGADWEWTYTDADEVMHVRQRTFVTAKRQGYTILWATPESGWAADEQAFERIIAGFRPATTSSAKPTTPTTPTTTKPSTKPPLPAYQLVGKASSRCLDVTNADSSTPVRLRIWDCGAPGDRNQSWTFAADGSIRLLDRCMDVLDASTDNAAPIRLAACTGTPGQRFALNEKQQLVNANSGKCLDVQAMSNENGALLQQFTCNDGAAHQKWTRNG